ncbi:serine protease inhibitor Kazal-type 13-like [Microcebus murinus]|uniref:serine protease inhibitor Kazal-type 13-like n=1 Tax=Microcebus murinus TaxID=30608 RepID=UPI003F6AF4D9
MAAFPCKTVLFLVCSTLAHPVFSGFLKRDDINRWPKPPCRMYHPVPPEVEANCPNITAYVCDTKGRTYQNECFFCHYQWDFGPSVQFEKYGKCSEG